MFLISLLSIVPHAAAADCGCAVLNAAASRRFNGYNIPGVYSTITQTRVITVNKELKNETVLPRPLFFKNM